MGYKFTWTSPSSFFFALACTSFLHFIPLLFLLKRWCQAESHPNSLLTTDNSLKLREEVLKTAKQGKAVTHLQGVNLSV